MTGDEIEPTEGEAGRGTGQLRAHLQQAEGHPCPALRGRLGDRRPDHALHAAEHEREQHGQTMELQHRLDEPRCHENDDPASQADRQRSPSTSPLRDHADHERPGQGDGLHEQHQPHEGGGLEPKLLESHARKLGDGGLHRTEHEHATDQHPREVVAVGPLPGLQKRTGE